MADSSGIKVQVESVVHEALANVLQAIWREHGIRVDSIYADWTDVSTVFKHEFKVERLSVHSITFPADTQAQPGPIIPQPKPSPR